MATNNLIITKEGLIRVSRELLNKRKYKKGVLTEIGSPFIVTNSGRLTSLSADSYVQYSKLDFSEAESIKVSVISDYTEPEDTATYQCLWSLNDISETLATMSLVIYPNKLSFLSGTSELFSIEDLEFINSTELNISLQLTSTTYQLILMHNKERKVFEGSLSQEISLSSYSQVQIGRTNVSPSNYWLNAIDLSTFIICKDGDVYFAPSTDPAFKFTKIMVSDGSIDLTDTSVEVLNHIYAFDIYELSRTSNTILLKATIDKDTHLDINQLGLYILNENDSENDCENQELFALIEGLTIKKSKDLGYELIFNVNLNLRVVNTTVLPDIVVVEEDYSKYTDFTDIKNIHTYITTNMERIITQNALKLGYGRTLKLIKNFTKMNIWNQNCLSTQRYSRIKESIYPTVDKTFNPDKVSTQGTPTVDSNGNMSDISTTNYAYSEDDLTFSSYDSWELEAGFKLGLGGTEQTIVNICAPTVNYPLLLGVTDINKCFIRLGELETLTATNSAKKTTEVFNRSPRNDLSIDDTNYYAWETQSGATLNNYYITTTGPLNNLNGVLSEFSTSAYATSKENISVSDGGSLTVNFTVTGSSTTGQTIFASTDNYYLLVEEKNNKLLYSFGNGVSWTISEGIGTTTLTPGTNYTLKLEYVSESIYAYLGDTIDYSATTTEIPNTLLRLGINSQTMNPFNGTINLNNCSCSDSTGTIWEGAIVSNLAYSNSINPVKNSALYDKRGGTFTNWLVSAITNGIIANEELFKVEPYTTYKVKVIFTGTSYSFYFDEGNSGTYEYISTVTSSTKINSSVNQYFGVTMDSTIKNPFSGTLRLQDYTLTTPEETMDFLNKEEVYNKLENYFPLYAYPYNYYKVYNLENKNHYITYLDGSILGNEDSIDFNNTLSSTLCVKFKLEDSENKLILVKTNLEDSSSYFTIEFKNRVLLVSIPLTTGETVELKKDYANEKLDGVVSNAMSVFITVNLKKANPVISMYVNNALVDSVMIESPDFYNASNYVLANYTDSSQVASTNYVSNVLYFDGVLTENQRYIVNNLLDTNF